MNVLMLVLADVVHDGRVRREAQALSAHGHRVQVIGLAEADVSSAFRLMDFDVHHLGLRTRKWPKTPPVQWLKYLEFVVRTWALGVRRRPDVVHAHDLNALLPATLVAKACGSRLVYDSHELWLESAPLSRRPRLEKSLCRLLEATLMRAVDRVITVSPGIADILRAWYGHEVAVVLNTPDRHTPTRASDYLRRACGLGDRDILLLYHGAVIPNRGIETALRALTLLPPEYHFACLGPASPHLAPLRDLARTLGVEQRFHYVAPVPPEDIVTTIAAADISLALSQPVCTSYKLAAGNKVFEAMAAGVPVIYADFPAWRALFEGIGLPCDPADPEALATAVRTLQGDPQLRARCRERELALHAGEYNWAVQQGILVDLYRTLQKEPALAGVG